MKTIQYGSERVIADNGGQMILKYYITETPVGFGYSDLKSYGVGILRTDKNPGLPDMKECKQIEGVFFDIEEAIVFMSKIKKAAILPENLTKVLGKYIEEKVKVQKEKRRKECIG